MPEELLETLDHYSRKSGKSRAAFIREACADYVARSQQDELDRQYVESYRKHPESGSESDWRLRNAAAVWGDEEWSEEDV